VLIVTDGFHEDRCLAISSELGLQAEPVPATNSPIKGWSTFPYFMKEAAAVAIGRVIGYSHLEWLHDVS
jgi:vancomycin permeability regulator SanA